MLTTAERPVGACVASDSRATFGRVFAADALLRSAYQIGKSPVLPVFAATLGAGDAFLGLIVSVSVATGLVLKPWIGWTVDRVGARALLHAALLIFVATPFAYRWVDTPGELAGVRLVHGLGTALLGPAGLVLVARTGTLGLAERLGWFGAARSLGYVLGPIVGGWMLASMNPVRVYDAVGLLSAVALWPIARLGAAPSRPTLRRVPWREAFGEAFRAPALWWSGGFEGAMYVALYAVKTFLPVYALAHDVSLLKVGGLLALQEGVHLAARPLCGRLADRFGWARAVAIGLAVIGAALICTPIAGHSESIAACFAALGIGSAAVSPALTALLARQTRARLGTGLGWAGALRNGGKIAGPIVGGALVAAMGFGPAVTLLGGSMLAGAAIAARTRV